MQKLVWQNSNGNEIDLTSGNYGITNWEGFSNTELNIQSQQVPFQDGGVFLDALMEQRELSVTLAMNDGGNLETRYRLRRELIHALNPKLGEGYLIYTNDFISKRIKCVAQIPLFETHNSNDSGTPKASLAWTACGPYWEDVEEKEVIIPISNHIEEIENSGDVPTEYNINIYSKNTENLFIGNTEITGQLPSLIEGSNGIGNKYIKSQEFATNLEKVSNEIYCNCQIDNEHYLLGGKSSILIFNTMTNEVENIARFEGTVFIADIQKINNVYYALVNPLEIIKNLTYRTSCDSSFIYSSTDGKTWVLVHTFDSNVLVRRIRYYNGNFYILNQIKATLLKSSDLNTFTSLVTTDYVNGYDLLVKANMIIVTGGSTEDINNYYGDYWISTDFINFTRTSLEGNLCLSVIEFQGKYIIGYSKYLASYTPFDTYQLRYSTDGVNWTENYYFEIKDYSIMQMSVNDGYLSLTTIKYDRRTPNTNNINNKIFNLDTSLNLLSTLSHIKYGFTIANGYAFGDSVYSYNIFEAIKHYNFYDYTIETPFASFRLSEDKWLFLYTITNGISYKYGTLDDLQTGTNTSIRINSLLEIFQINDKVFIMDDFSVGNPLYCFSEDTIARYYIPNINGDIQGITKKGNYIYVYTTDWTNDWFYKLDLDFNIIDYWSKTSSSNSSFSLIFYIKNKFVLYSRTGFTGESYPNGSHVTLELNDINKTFSFTNISQNGSMFYYYRYKTGRAQEYYNEANNIYYMNLGNPSKLYYSINGLYWSEIENNDLVKDIIIYEGLTFLLCNNHNYISYDGINFSIFENDEILNMAKSDNKLYYFDKYDDEYELYINDKDNIINKIQNEFFVPLKVGNNKINIFRTSGNGTIKIIYRQKYIGV